MVQGASCVSGAWECLRCVSGALGFSAVFRAALLLGRWLGCMCMMR